MNGLSLYLCFNVWPQTRGGAWRAWNILFLACAYGRIDTDLSCETVRLLHKVEVKYSKEQKDRIAPAECRHSPTAGRRCVDNTSRPTADDKVDPWQ